MLTSMLARSASAAVTVTLASVVALATPLPAADAATAGAVTSSSTVLSEGVGMGAAPSTRVRRVQRILDRRGFDLGPPGVDGRFGPLTAAAVRRMQERYGLTADGIVGPKTRQLLRLLAAASRSARRPRSQQLPRAPRRSTTPTPRQSQPPTPRQSQTPTPRQSQAPTPRQSTTPRQSAAPHPAAPPQATTRRQTTSAPESPMGASATDQGTGTTLPTLLAALAVLLAGGALAVAIRRGRPGSARTPAMAAIDRDLYLEGQSDDPDVGRFGGFALATAVPRDAADDPREARYLVDDPRKPAPVWVRGRDIRRSPSQMDAGESVIGYVTIDPDPTREERAFLAIEERCEQAGWKLEEIVRDADTGRMVGRPGLKRALERIAAGKARGVVVSEVRSLARSVGELGALLAWFRDADAALIALDLDLDTATGQGHATAGTLIALAEWERERGGSRARRGMARVQTPDRTSIQTAEDRAALAERIAAMREAGMSLQAIANQLNAEGLPPLHGHPEWRPAMIQAVLANLPASGGAPDELPSIPPNDRRPGPERGVRRHG